MTERTIIVDATTVAKLASVVDKLLKELSK